MKLDYHVVERELKKLANTKQATTVQRFFKIGKGEYGEGDIFIGIRVPLLRKVAKKYFALSLLEVQRLLHSNIHEHRLVALLIWTYQFKKANATDKKKIYTAYLRNISYINNWDLVDITSHIIMGEYLLSRSRKPLYVLARSGHLWKKRIAIISTYAFIRHGEYTDTLRIARLLLQDNHDLIHKAVGWMLREVGNREKKTEVAFLRSYAKKMPRTMLRYAIEKFPESERQTYLAQEG